MVHTAVAYARQKDRLQTCAVLRSVGPGATNMVTGAALATINRLPVLLLPADIFADRVAVAGAAGAGAAVRRRRLGQRRVPAGVDASSTGSGGPSSCRPRCWRAMRVLTDPAETGAATLALPQDVQAAGATTGRSSCSPSGSGTSPGRCPSPRSLEAGGRADPRRQAAADRGRRRRALLRAPTTRCGVRRGHRHPGRADPGRQGLAASTTTRSAWARSARPAPPRPTRSPARPTW